ncbi:MAG: hypothetical protein AB1331_07260 [Bacillota bacterium]
MLRGEHPEAAGLGAAIVAAVGLGFYPDFPQAVATMVRHRDIFCPRPEVAGVYQQLYFRVYKRMHSTLQPLYREIREERVRQPKEE